jgi:hypothetical protein
MLDAATSERKRSAGFRDILHPVCCDRKRLGILGGLIDEEPLAVCGWKIIHHHHLQLAGAAETSHHQNSPKPLVD